MAVLCNLGSNSKIKENTVRKKYTCGFKIKKETIEITKNGKTEIK